MQSRREFVIGAAAGFAAAPAWAASSKGGIFTLPFSNGERPLVRYPQKRPMIGLTARPPQLETPFGVFREGAITPNDAFFVRYHLSGLPSEIDPATWRLTIGGHVTRPLSLSLEELKRDFPVHEIVAVNQCSGNSRGLFSPRVGGGQLGNGAMGNARWRGVTLRALLDRAGLLAGARQATFNGIDNPPVDSIPDFIKALDIDHARDGEVMVAWEMNGASLPFLNGYPLRLVVPGYYGTYWIKHLNEINVVDERFDGYWMKTAYRIPDNECACVEPGTKPEKTRPISRLNVRSFITSHQDEPHRTRKDGVRWHRLRRRKRHCQGAALGRWRPAWSEATLGEDLGRYSFREWRIAQTLAPGRHDVKVRAVARSGETQPLEPSWQPAGYMRNVVETLTVLAS